MARNVRQSRALGTGKPFTLPAPYNGINLRENRSALPADQARELCNWFPDSGELRPRKGWVAHASGIGTGEVKTLAELQSKTAPKLVAIGSNGTVYNATNSGAASVINAAGYSDTRFQTANKDGWLFGVNGSETPWRYDGSTFGATGLSGAGLTLTNLINVADVRFRLWFCEKDSADVWYGPLGGVTGTLTKFQLSQIASGGFCMAIGSWSRDSGDGPDDVVVFVMSTGEVIVYQGDPATSFSLIGKFEGQKPVGRQCLVKMGGELIVTTYGGFEPVSTLYTGTSDLRVLEPAGRVSPGVVTDAHLYRNNPGWNSFFHDGVLYFVVPTSTGAASKQWVLNTRTPAWTTFDYPAAQFAQYDNDLYFASLDGGFVRKIDGATDNGTALTLDARSGFDYPGGPSRNLKYTAMRPNITGKGRIQGRLNIDPDFATRSLSAPALVDILPAASSTPWGSPWGSPWGIKQKNPEKWFNVNGRGRSVAVAIRVVTSASEVVWDSTDILAQAGNAR